MELTSKKRIDYYDIAKGIGIIMVVWAHASGPFSNYIYQMHMPFFFLISGLLYNTRSDLKSYAIRKVQTLYIPFAFWNLLAFTFRMLYGSYSLKTILKNDLKVLLTLTKDGIFFGATWFLGALFVISIAYKFLDTLIKEPKRQRSNGNIHCKDILMLLFSGIMAFVAFRITFPYQLSRTIICGFFFAIGVFAKKYAEKLKKMDCLGTVLACSCVFLLIARFAETNMGLNEYNHPLLFMIGAVAASYAVIFLCKKLDAHTGVFVPLKRGLIYLGRNSSDIVIWHFNAFKLVVVFQMFLMHDEMTWMNVFAHHPCYISSGLWWVVYTIAGIAGSLLFGKLLRFGPWGKLLKKLHIV